MVKKIQQPTHQELSEQVMEMSGQTHGPDRHVVRAIGLQILSNARLEASIKGFEKSTKKTENKMQGLATAQVRLAVAQIILAVVAIIVTIALSIIFYKT